MTGALPPGAEKSLKGLGKGLGGQPFSKRVSPNYAVYTPRQTRICSFVLYNDVGQLKKQGACFGVLCFLFPYDFFVGEGE